LILNASKLTPKKRKFIEASAWKGINDFEPPSAQTIQNSYQNIYFLIKKDFSYNFHGKKIINVGGGHGREAEILIRNGAKSVVIVDIALGQLNSAITRKKKHRLNRLDVILADAEHLPFKNKAFDLGYIVAALHHFPSHENSITEICRVSKEIIFLDIMNASITRILNLFGLFKKEWCGIEPNRLNENEVRIILKNNEFDMKITYFFLPFYKGNFFLINNFLEPVAKVINFAISKNRIISLIFGNIALIQGKCRFINTEINNKDAIKNQENNSH
jgi:SAM-dependent methyltransferase